MHENQEFGGTFYKRPRLYITFEDLGRSDSVPPEGFAPLSNYNSVLSEISKAFICCSYKKSRYKAAFYLCNSLVENYRDYLLENCGLLRAL